MALIPAICKQCGGKITVDTDREKTFCMCCGTEYIDDNDNLNEIEIKLQPVKFKITEMKDYEGAYDFLESIEDEACSNGEYWWLRLQAFTNDFSGIKSIMDVEEAYNYYSLAKNILNQLSDEQYKLFYGFLIISMRQARIISKAFVKENSDLELIQNVHMTLERRWRYKMEDPEIADVFEKSSDILGNVAGSMAENAIASYTIYQKLKEDVQRFEAGERDFQWNNPKDYMYSAVCWNDPEYEISLEGLCYKANP